jgi:hypothetical protein
MPIAIAMIFLSGCRSHINSLDELSVRTSEHDKIKSAHGFDISKTQFHGVFEADEIDRICASLRALPINERCVMALNRDRIDDYQIAICFTTRWKVVLIKDIENRWCVLSCREYNN